MNLPAEMVSYYGAGREHARLITGAGRLEFLRTLNLIKRHAPKPPAHVLDVGGGAGIYSFELAKQGYVVDLVDAIPIHIEQARANLEGALIHRMEVGDARSLDYPNNSFDLVLLLGPLYHLTDLEDRNKALLEAKRVLRPGGTIIAAAISRYASLFDGYFRGFIKDPVFAQIVDRDLTDGQHHNPTDNPSYFTTTKFHTRRELAAELIEAGLEDVRVFAVEGFGWLIPNLAQLDEAEVGQILKYLEKVESEPELIGTSAHLLGIATKPGESWTASNPSINVH